MAIQISYNSEGIQAKLDAAGTAVQPGDLPGDTLMLGAGDATSIASGQDLNSYTTPGNYKVTTSSAAQGISNCPTTVAGRLLVLTSSQGTYYTQIYLAATSAQPKIYMRHKLDTSQTTRDWTSWVSLISSGTEEYQNLVSALAEDGGSWGD